MTESVEPTRTRRRPNSVEPAGQHRLFLSLSLMLNLGMLLFLTSAFQKSEPHADQAIPLPDAMTQENRSAVIRRIAARPNSISPWKQLESTDLAVYAANLRAAGCPPRTVRDILLPLIEETFEHTELPVTGPTNFWANFSQRQAAAAARAEQESALRQEKDKMLKELLGFAWSSDGLNRAYAGESAGTVGFLDYERAEKLLCIADRQPFSRVGRSHRIAHRSAIYQAWRQEAGEVLSPTEFEETELRGMLMIYQRQNPNLCKAGLSGSELRQLMVFRRELCNPLPSALLAGGDQLLHELEWADEQEVHAKALRLLGEHRFIDYLKTCDASVERTLAALEKERLPRSLMLQLFDFRKEAMARAQEIRLLPIRRGEKRAHLAALRQSAIEQLAALSEAADESPLVEMNRDWLQEIAHP